MLSYHLSFIPALIIILREIFISGLRENMAQYKFSIIVSILAKWKTTIQLFACGSFLVWRSDPFFFQIQIIGLDFANIAMGSSNNNYCNRY